MAFDNHSKEFAELPAVAELETKPKQRIIALLEQLDKTETERKALEEQEDDIKTELELLQKETDKPGFRHGLLCFKAQKMPGRKTLDRLMLVENGCPAAVIAQSYKEGNAYTQRTFKRLKEES